MTHEPSASKYERKNNNGNNKPGRNFNNKRILFVEIKSKQVEVLVDGRMVHGSHHEFNIKYCDSVYPNRGEYRKSNELSIL